jgi:hypothetical protein
MTFSKTRRRSLRRHVGVICSVASQLWDGTVEFAASDISHEGLWIDTPYPLELGEEVVLSFVPPGARYHEDVWAVAAVARVGLWDTSSVPWEAGMGLSFTYFSAIDRRFLAHSLIGRPPRLPRKRALMPLTHQPPPLPAREPPALQECAPSSAPARAPTASRVLAASRARSTASANLGFADVPPVLDADLAFEFEPRPLGELLTAPRPQATARGAAWGLA